MPKTITHFFFIAIALVFISFTFDYATAIAADTAKTVSTGDVSHIQNSKAFEAPADKNATPAYQGRQAK